MEQAMMGSRGSLNGMLREAESEELYEMIQNRSVRVHTVRVDLSRLSRTPCLQQVLDFVGRNLEVQRNDLVRMQWCRRERCLFLKMCDQPTAEALVGMHSGRHRFPTDSARPRVALTLEDGTVEVVLHDLSELVGPEEVYGVLGQYGVVQNVMPGRWSCDQRFDGVDNGKLIVRMVVRRPIPRELAIGQEVTGVTYEGQPEPTSSLLAGLVRTVQGCFRQA